MSETDPEAEAGLRIERLTQMNCAQCGTAYDVSQLEPFTGVECPDCGNQDTVPAKFGNFLLLNLISTGGMGGVYRARDESLGRLVAIKVMLPALGEDAEFVENFKREAQAAARLNHPHVAQIYSYGQVQGQPYIVMELVSGQRFDRLIDGKNPLPVRDVLRIGLDIAEGLQAAEEIGLIHGDIKPENILLDEKREAKLVDFGIASFTDQTAQEGVWGTPYYIAPEKVKKRRSDARSDIFSLGATLFHALAGVPPFDGETPLDVVKARLTETAPLLSKVREGIPKAVEDTIARTLELEPARRHPNYKSLIGDLRRALDQVGDSGGSPLRTTGGKRLVVKKRATALKVPGGSSSGGNRVIVPRSGDPLNATTQISPEQHAARQRRRKHAALGCIFGFLAVVLLGVGVLVAVILQAKKAVELEQRRLQYELTTARESAHVTYAALSEAATNVVEYAPRFDPLEERIRQIVKDAIDYDLETPAPIRPDVPAAAVPEVASRSGADAVAPVDGPAADGDASANDGEAEAEPVEAAEPEPEPDPAAGGDGLEAPLGMPSREEFERQRRARQRPGATDPVVDVIAEVVVAEPEATPGSGAGAIPSAADPELVTKGRDVMEACAQARGFAAHVPQMMGEARDLYRQATNTVIASSARQYVAAMSNQVVSFESMLKDMRALYVEADEGVRVVDAMARETIAQRKAEAARLEALRLEQERQAKRAAELVAAKALRGQGTPLIQQWRFADAVDLARSGLTGFETEPARDIAGALVERYELLVELKAYLVERISAEPCKWCWIRSATSREDILAASADGVQLRGREVSWAMFSPGQFIRVVEYYAGNPRERTSRRGRAYLAVAIYCEENGGADAARRYRAKALDVAPFLGDLVERTMPRQ